MKKIIIIGIVFFMCLFSINASLNWDTGLSFKSGTSNSTIYINKTISTIPTIEDNYILLQNLSYTSDTIEVNISNYNYSVANNSIYTSNFPYLVALPDDRLDIRNKINSSINATLTFPVVSQPESISYSSVNGVYTQTYTQEDFTYNTQTQKITLDVVGLEYSLTGVNRFTFNLPVSDTTGATGGDEIIDVQTTTSGGGGTEIIYIQEQNNKNLCDITFNPSSINITKVNSVYEFDIKNNENILIKPSFSFSHLEGEKSITDKLRVTNNPDVIESNRFTTIGVNLKNSLFSINGESKAYLIVSFEQCKDIQIPINTYINESSSFVSVIENIIENKTISEVVIDLGNKQFFESEKMDSEKSTFDKIFEKVFSVLGISLILSTIFTLLILPNNNYQNVSLGSKAQSTLIGILIWIIITLFILGVVWVIYTLSFGGGV